MVSEIGLAKNKIKKYQDNNYYAIEGIQTCNI